MKIKGLVKKKMTWKMCGIKDIQIAKSSSVLKSCCLAKAFENTKTLTDT